MLFTSRREKWMQEMMTVRHTSNAGEQFFISFGADAVEGQGGVRAIS